MKHFRSLWVLPLIIAAFFGACPADTGTGPGSEGTVNPVPVSKISINEGNFELAVGNTKTLTTNVQPENAGNKGVTWKSSDEGKATVTANGLVTAIAAGSAVITATAKDGSGQSASVTVTVKEDNYGYLLAYFKRSNESLYFALSKDGMTFTAVNSDKPIFTPKTGSKAVRDPFIVKSPDGREYYMVATDLKSGNSNTFDGTWGGNRTIYTWKSTDLVNWTDETLIDAGDYPSINDAHKMWAPEAIWDATAYNGDGGYMLYWTLDRTPDTAGASGTQTGHIIYAHTKDFKTMTEPQFLYQNPSGKFTLDANIIEHEGTFYMYVRGEDTNGLKGVWLVTSDKITGPYTNEFLVLGQNYEGPNIFKLFNGNGWILLVDRIGGPYRYLPMTALKQNYADVPTNNTVGLNAQHGSVIPISEERYNAVSKGGFTLE